MAPSLFGAAFKSPRLGARTRSTSTEGSGAIQVAGSGGLDISMERQQSGAARQSSLKLPMPQQLPPGGGELPSAGSSLATAPGGTTPARGLMMDEVCARCWRGRPSCSLRHACMLPGSGFMPGGAQGCRHSLHACHNWWAWPQAGFVLMARRRASGEAAERPESW